MKLTARAIITTLTGGPVSRTSEYWTPDIQEKFGIDLDTVLARAEAPLTPEEEVFACRAAVREARQQVDRAKADARGAESNSRFWVSYGRDMERTIESIRKCVEKGIGVGDLDRLRRILKAFDGRERKNLADEEHALLREFYDLWVDEAEGFLLRTKAREIESIFEQQMVEAQLAEDLA